MLIFVFFLLFFGIKTGYGASVEEERENKWKALQCVWEHYDNALILTTLENPVVFNK